MPSALSATYLLPAILLNPAFILHLINTFVSHLIPPSPPVMSQSPHPFMESIGPVPGSTPYFDMHADDRICWRYTAVMVVVQILAIGRVQDNRVQRRHIKAAKVEREQSRREGMEVVGEERKLKSIGTDGTHDSVDEGNGNAITNGAAAPPRICSEDEIQIEEESEATEISEDEMMN